MFCLKVLSLLLTAHWLKVVTWPLPTTGDHRVPLDFFPKVESWKLDKQPCYLPHRLYSLRMYYVSGAVLNPACAISTLTKQTFWSCHYYHQHQYLIHEKIKGTGDASKVSEITSNWDLHPDADVRAYVIDFNTILPLGIHVFPYF